MLLAEYNYDTDIAVQRKEAFDDGISQGELQAKIQTAKNMLVKNIPIDVIAECTGLSQETVEQLAKDNFST